VTRPALCGGAASARSLLAAADWERIGASLGLSDREIAIIEGITREESGERIARRLRISRHTVHSHLVRARQKLGVSGNLGLVVAVFREYLRISPR
jgi:DNA-binding CsgD family transcriptional regulator